MKKYLVLIFILTCITAFKTVTDKLFIKPLNFPEPVYSFKNNKLTKDKIALGKMLFNEPLLSKDTTISCASCHSSYAAFSHNDHDLSHGIKNRIGTRNAATIFNLAWKKNFMWDGAIHHLDVQTIAPITNKDEMDESLTNVVLKLKNNKKYKQLFCQAFKDSSITSDKILKSISQFLITIVSATSKYDKVIRKEKGFAFTSYEFKGYELFKSNCASCHKEPLFTNDDFENNGLAIDKTLNDLGRFKITQNPLDSLKFKVPSLRNCEVTYPYMHDGRYKNLQMVLYHYTNNIHTSNTLSPTLKNGLILNEEDKNCLIAFLKTLTDEEFLNDDRFK